MVYGYDGMLMCQIISGVSVNLVVVNYYFGIKELLMQEVFCCCLDWLNEECMCVFSELECEVDGKVLKFLQIVDGFFGILLCMVDDDMWGGMIFLYLFGCILIELLEFI